jgi:5-methylcytosine-specific restriction endonuclease McrA
MTLFSSFIFCETTLKQINDLPENLRLKFYEAVTNYGIYNVEPHFTGLENTIWISMKDIIDQRRTHSGVHHWNWKGGITSENHRIRESTDYKHWIRAVFIRDNFTCQKCGKKGGKLNAHHIKKFSKYPKLRLVADNGITLCETCHKKQHKENGGYHGE